MLKGLASHGQSPLFSRSEIDSRSQKKQIRRAASVSDTGDKDKKSTYREQLSRREVFKLGLGAALLPCGCPKPSFADGGGGPYWDYSQDTGPGKWGGVCALGRNQSPVDLPVIKTVTSKLDFRMDYSRTAKISVINTAHGNFNVKIPPGNFARVGPRKLELVQYHFHTPSEHAFNGRREAMEVHLVHKDTETGELAVLGVLLQRGAFQRLPSLDLAMELAPPIVVPQKSEESKQIGPIDLAQILGDMLPSVGNRGHFEHYVGSLTTPPCSESVQWYVATTFASVTDAQILDFMTATNGGKGFQINARPIQDFRNDEFKLDVL